MISKAIEHRWAENERRDQEKQVGDVEKAVQAAVTLEKGILPLIMSSCDISKTVAYGEKLKVKAKAERNDRNKRRK
ncbi:hypothetical protein ACFX13_044085 [Malus domestica]